MLDWLKCFFGLHDWGFAGADTQLKPSSERWYWHLEDCRRCDVRRSVLNGYCSCKGEV